MSDYWRPTNYVQIFATSLNNNAVDYDAKSVYLFVSTELIEIENSLLYVRPARIVGITYWAIWSCLLKTHIVCNYFDEKQWLRTILIE